MLTKALGKRNNGKHCILNFTPDLCSFQQVCIFVYSMSVLRDTYALHGFPGSGHSSAECEARWTRLM